MLMLRQLRWAGHVSRMDDTRIPKAMFCCELRQGRRDRGPPRRRHKDHLKRQLTLVNIDHKGWEQLTADRDNWRATSRRAAQNVEVSRRETAEEKRRRRNQSASRAPTGKVYFCPNCPRASKSRIGLHSHQKACHHPKGQRSPTDLRKRRNF
jgi:transcription termination factor 2